MRTLTSVVDIKAAQRICRRHYGRTVTAQQAIDEVANVQRKHAAGTLDDKAQRLWAALACAELVP